MKIVIDGQEVELASGGNEGGGLSQEEADERYLQLSGGRSSTRTMTTRSCRTSPGRSARNGTRLA